MINKEELFQNKYRTKSTRLQNWDYSNYGYYFVTICTKDRICLFGDVKDGKMDMSWQGRIVEKFWTELNNNHLGIKLDDFIIMPNHIHGIIVLHGNIKTINKTDHNNVETIRGVETIHELSLREKNDKNIDNRVIRRKMLIPKIIGRFKMQTTKEINIIQKTIGNKLWQPGYYDRIIRNEKELYEIRKYISFNPQKWQWDRNNPDNTKY